MAQGGDPAPPSSTEGSVFLRAEGQLLVSQKQHISRKLLELNWLASERESESASNNMGLRTYVLRG